MQHLTAVIKNTPQTNQPFKSVNILMKIRFHHKLADNQCLDS